ncbi:MAG: hypothetical protein MK179_01060 [Pirellulaceae bacterium]|nr:hypothetical protein [Pirellulaceae bacterium]
MPDRNDDPRDDVSGGLEGFVDVDVAGGDESVRVAVSDVAGISLDVGDPHPNKIRVTNHTVIP